VVVEWFRAVSSGGVLNEEGRELVVEEIQSVMNSNRGVTKGLYTIKYVDEREQPLRA
jgi:hypothetical protein